MRKIVFVCYGNIHRSVTAEYYLRKILERKGIENIEVISRGLMGSADFPKPGGENLRDYPRDWQEAKLVFDNFEIDTSDQRATPITLDDVTSADLVVAMNQDILNRAGGLYDQFPGYKNRMLLFPISKGYSGVEDPYGKNFVISMVIFQIIAGLEINLDLYVDLN